MRSKEDLKKDVLMISSGTIANLIGDPRYSTIDKVQLAWFQWVEETTHDYQFQNWQESWHTFKVE